MACVRSIQNKFYLNLAINKKNSPSFAERHDINNLTT